MAADIGSHVFLFMHTVKCFSVCTKVAFCGGEARLSYSKYITFVLMRMHIY